MEKEEKTTIAISNKLWKQLNDYKTKPNESFEDVIKKFISNKQKEETK